MVTYPRHNTQQAYFSETRSLVLLHSRFYWTGQREVFTEELNEGTYYHNRLDYVTLGKSRLG